MCCSGGADGATKCSSMCSGSGSNLTRSPPKRDLNLVWKDSLELSIGGAIFYGSRAPHIRAPALPSRRLHPLERLAPGEAAGEIAGGALLNDFFLF